MNAMNDVELVTLPRNKLLTPLLIISPDLMDAESVLTKLPIVAKVAVGVKVSLYLTIVNLITLIIVLHIGYGGGGGGYQQSGGGGGGYGQQGGGGGGYGKSSELYFLQMVMLTFLRRWRLWWWWWWWGKILKLHMVQVGKSASDKVAY